MMGFIRTRIIYPYMRKKRFKGMNIGPWYWVLPELPYMIENYIEAHEQTHVDQFWRTWGLAPIRSIFDKKYYLKMEVEAYRAAIKAGQDISSAAYWLANLYGFKIKIDEAHDMLLGD